MNSPLILQLAGISIRHWKLSVFYSMCQLEYNTQNKSRHQGKYQKSYKPGQEPNSINGYYDKKENEKHFKAPENNMILKAHFLKRRFANLPLEVLLKIQNKN